MILTRLKRLALAAAPALFGLIFLPESALAQCCAPPTPPPAPCCGAGPQVNVPGVTVNVGASVIVNASASAIVNTAGRGGVVVVGGGGGSHGGYSPGPVTVIQGLNVEGARRADRSASRTRMIVLRAVCIDDKAAAHAASQVRPDRDVDEAYQGELYRCLAGTRLQASWADFTGSTDFERGESLTCAKGEALYYGGAAAGGQVECRPQTAARQCNERSLLRRYGAGVKVLKATLTAHEEVIETVETRSSLSLDGGVGGVVW